MPMPLKRGMEAVETKKQYTIIKLWIYIVCVLSAFTNIAAYMAYTIAVSHHSGNVIYIFTYPTHQISINIILLLIVLVVLFTIGSIVAAFINKNEDFKMEHKYGEVQLVIGIGLLLLYVLPVHMYVFVSYLTLALGVENGLIRSFRGLGFKTTHITGTLSDMGSMIGYWMQKIEGARWKAIFEISLFVGFLFGTFIGVVIFKWIGDTIFILSGISYIALGIVYFMMRHQFKQSK